jgi:hypothetical protein
MPTMFQKSMTTPRPLRYALAILLALAVADVTTLAQRGRGNVRSSSRSSVSRSANVNRGANVNRSANVNRNVNANRNVNRNIDVDRDIDVDIDVDHRYGGCCYHSGGGAFVAGAVVGAAVTAAVVGSRVNTLPPACQVVIINGFAYQQCGTVWYQPQMSGSSTTYIVVNAPR